MKLLFGKVCPCTNQSKQTIKTGLCTDSESPLVVSRTALRFVVVFMNHAI
jgi:hypothetical protein